MLWRAALETKREKAIVLVCVHGFGLRAVSRVLGVSPSTLFAWKTNPTARSLPGPRPLLSAENTAKLKEKITLKAEEHNPMTTADVLDEV